MRVSHPSDVAQPSYLSAAKAEALTFPSVWMETTCHPSRKLSELVISTPSTNVRPLRTLSAVSPTHAGEMEVPG